MQHLLLAIILISPIERILQYLIFIILKAKELASQSECELPCAPVKLLPHGGIWLDGFPGPVDGDIHWEGGGQEEVSHKVPSDNLRVDAAKLKPGGRQGRPRGAALERYWLTISLACGCLEDSRDSL